MKKRNNDNSDKGNGDGDGQPNNNTNNNTSDNNSTDNNNIVDITEIRLEKGVVQTINMPMGKTISKFVFTPLKDKENSIVKIIQVQGHIDYTIKDKSDDKQNCDSKVLAQTGDDQCEFQSVLGHDYLVTVQAGDKDEVQMFTILYSS